MERLCHHDVLKSRFIGEMVAMDGGGVGSIWPEHVKSVPATPVFVTLPKSVFFELEKNPYAITNLTFLHSFEHLFWV